MDYQIHETVIRDIVDIISDVKKSDEVEWLRNRKRSFSSIAKASANLTLVFPVLVSKNMNIENASMISKAIERKAVTMLQMLFSAINITDSKSGIDYLKNFHTNLKIDDNITVDDFIDIMDKYVAENAELLSHDNRMLYEQVKQDLKNINFILPDSINELSLNNYKIYPQSYFGESIILKEDTTKTTTSTVDTNIWAQGWNPNENDPRNPAGYSKPIYDKDGKLLGYEPSKTINSVLGTRKNTTTVTYTTKDPRDIQALTKDKLAAMKSKQDLVRGQLLDTDVKKANELIPSMMVVNYINASTGEPIPDQMIIGVKAKIYALDSVDIINRIKIKNQDHRGLLKFIKATTREISFFKDFLFAIDKAKIDALSQSRRGSSSKLWKILERRSTKSKIRRAMGRVNDASAISTLVITQEEVEYLKKTENINLEKPEVIRPIMESYNLMGFCIVDETMEIAKFIFDTGNDIYETMSFTLLERETSDNGYKKVINLMTKIAR